MLVALIIFVSAMVQGVMGFGMALIAMPLLVTLLGIQVAVPSFALIGTVTTLFNVVRLRRDVTLQDVGRLALPAMIGIPLGVWLLGRVDPIVVTRLLGSGLILYAAYELLAARFPRFITGSGPTSWALRPAC